MSFSKNKGKRPRSSSSETKNSFVKNVTSRVSGLLPATITKWFSSPSSSNTNGSAQTGDATDSSSEDEAPESPIALQPPAKTMRYSSPNKFTYYGPTDANCASRSMDTLDSCGPYHLMVPSLTGRTTFTRETNYTSTPYRPPNDEALQDRSDQDSAYKSQHCVSAVGRTVATKRKSLFDSSSANSEASKKACAKTACNAIRDPSQPYFKPSLLGSPFYSGRTTYGGAATSYINRPNVKERRNATVKESSNTDNTISNTTRRIMDLLEHYSSPLSEAKRIPVVSTTKNNSWDANSSSNPNVPKVLSYKTQELLVPSIASILRVKQRSRLMDTTNAARQIIASHSSTMHDYTPNPSHNKNTDVNHKFTTKVKTKLSRVTRGNSCDLETNLLTPVKLPEAVLQIDQSNLPKFLFEKPASKPICSTPAKPTFNVSQPLIKIAEPQPKSPISDSLSRKSESQLPKVNPFKFSSPVRLPNEQAQSPTTPPKFTFGSPERSVEKVKINEKKDQSSCVIGSPTEIENKLTTSNSIDWQCVDCWDFNKTVIDECISCGAEKPSTYNDHTKSNDYKLTDSESNKNEINNSNTMNNIEKPLSVKQPDSSKWDCKDNWVTNEESTDECVYSGASNLKKSSAKVNSADNNTSSQWKCDECWIKNKDSDSNCAACGSPKPGGEPTASAAVMGFFSSPTKPPDNTFKVLIAKQSDKWECPGCLVRNESDKTRCICCDYEKPGTEATKEPEMKSFTFGVVPAFKFGISSQTQVAAKPAEVKAIVDFNKTLQESETNNNVLPKAPTFTFGLPTQKSDDPSKKEGDMRDDSPKLNFSFCVPKSTPPAAPSAVSIFGNSNRMPESASKRVSEDEEKPQEVPKIIFSVPDQQERLKPVPSLFSSPLNKQTEDKQFTVSPSLLSSSKAVEKNETTSSLLTFQPAADMSETTPKPAFTLSVKPGLSTFAAPAATTSTSIPFANPLQPPPYTASNSTMSFTNPLKTAPTTATTSLFQQAAEPTVTTTATSLFLNTNSSSNVGSLFQNPTTVTTTTPSAFGNTTPLFSFGNNIQTGSQQEKPFFVSFGNNNKTETPSPFKPAFNASSENKFTLEIGAGTNNGLTHTTMGGGNGLPPANPLGSGNGLSMSSPLGGNIMPSGNNITTNPLGASEVPSNLLSGGSGLQAGSGGIFGTSPAVQKENVWSTSNNNNTNLFVSNTATTPQKPAATFTFGSTTPAFGASNPPTFGNNAQPAPVFGLPNQNTTNSSSLFTSSPQRQPAAVFGTPTPAANPSSAVGMFGTPAPNVGATPTFGTPNRSIPSFETPSLTAGPAPAFTFGSPPQQTTVFGFGQELPPQQPGAVYNFGGAASAPQFNIGNSGAPQQQRRFRKAVRRNNR
ncbi:nuclear pore complex protein Nup153 [Hyposmocoma kahamanoa]|uniref:nuclear pore complex protein Nup153 n=1 Tax=Hyposmocoma kahamanoa TaxID=1477025 RepID=UPI000E6D90BE|nr:nuclear pore complex protein Nup153 [Hyposmocoma kahamanoa]